MTQAVTVTSNKMPHLWRKLSIRIKLLLPVIIANIIAFTVLVIRVPQPINTLVESNVHSDFAKRLSELQIPITQFLADGQTDLQGLAASSEMESVQSAQSSGDKGELVAAQSGLASVFAGKITEDKLPYADIRYLTLDGKQLVRATARQIGGAVSGQLVPISALVTEDIAGYSVDLNKLPANGSLLLPVRLSSPDKSSGLAAEPLIELAAPIFAQSKQTGVMIISLRARGFLVQAFAQSSKTTSSRSILVDQTGRIIAVSNPSAPDQVSVMGDADTSALTAALPVKTLDGTAQTLQAINDRVYSALALNKSSRVPQNQWLLIVDDDLNTVYSGARDLEATLFITLGIVFLVAIGGIGLVSQSVIQPLVAVSQTADRISAGDLEAKTRVHSEDEVGMVALALNTMSTRLSELIRTLESRVRERTRNIEIAAEISRDTTQLTSLNDLLQRTVNAVRDRFGLYHVQIFLADEANEYAVLVIGTGESAEQMLAEDHKLKIGSASIVGQAMAKSRIVATLDTTHSGTAHRFNPYLPLTRSEMAVPLKIGETTIGVLDIQSIEQNAFDAEDENTFQMIANQLAIAVNNTRLFEGAQQARQNADEANRQKSDFLSTMSHELRTPLNVIIGYSHSILTRPAMYDNVALPDAYASAIDSIKTSGQHLLGLINDILDLSKIEAGKIDLEVKATDVLPILEGVRSTALGLVKAGVQVRADYPSTLPLCVGDELRIRQILLNLLSNAAKFTTQGFITINAVPQDDNLLFSVSDTGSGIPTESQPYIFERFKQGSASVARKFGGTGLGLSISKQLAKMHGGDLWFSSEVGQGSTFYFTIPLAPAGIKPASTSVAVSPLSATVGTSRAHIFLNGDDDEPEILKQILIVDTSSESRAILENALNQIEYSVLSADSAERAVNIATLLMPDAIVIHLHDADSADMKALPERLRADKTLVSSAVVIIPDASLTPEALNNAILEQVQAVLVA